MTLPNTTGTGAGSGFGMGGAGMGMGMNGTSSNGGTAPGTPSAGGDAGVYDSGRPRRTRAAMGR